MIVRYGNKIAKYGGSFLNAENTAPVADFSFSASDLSVSFDASSSYDIDGNISSYSWDFGDGSTGSGVTVSHTYAEAGTYNVVLSVIDSWDYIGTKTIEILIPEYDTVPFMTSDTTPSPFYTEWSSSDTQNFRYAYNAWDGDNTTWWRPASMGTSDNPAWNRLYMDTPRSIWKWDYEVKMLAGGGFGQGTFYLRDDEENTIHSFFVSNSQEGDMIEGSVEFSPTKKSSYFEIYYVNSNGFTASEPIVYYSKLYLNNS